MAYVHCMPARIILMRHGLDNVVSGTLRTPDDEMVFRTRGHIVKATNRIYRGTAWKPQAGADVLVDGDLTATGLIVDHIEPDLIGGDRCDDQHLEEIAKFLPSHPPASATLRVWRASAPYRLRFAKPITGEGRKNTPRPGILHAAYDPDGAAWRAWTTAQEGGELVQRGIDLHALSAIAAEVGIDIAPPQVGEIEVRAPALAQNESDNIPF